MIGSFYVSASPPPISVLIDPGHGGRDHGTEKNGQTEAQITLTVAHRLYDLLHRDSRFKPSLTRETAQGISLSERARLTLEKQADLFLSIHVNSSPNPHAKGAEFYFQNQLPPDEEAMLLAHQENEQENLTSPRLPYPFLDRPAGLSAEVSTIVSDLLDHDRIVRSSQLAKALKLAWHGSRKSRTNSVRQAPFYVLSQITTPSALVELGFLSNDDDFRDLTLPAMQDKMATDLYRGLIRYGESFTNGNASR